MSRQVTRVLVVDDSQVSREFIVHLLRSDPDIEVIGTASEGEGALEAVQRLQPDVVTMDIHMPGMDGLEATRLIMETRPTPIVIVSGSSPASEVARTFATVEAGALAVLPHPQGVGHPEHETSARKFVDTVKLMSEVKVVRRWAHRRRDPKPPAVRVVASTTSSVVAKTASTRARVVALGASTGGPPTLRAILAGLPKDFPLPLLIVQHMSDGFIGGFCEWLGESTGFPVEIAGHGDQMLPGHAYLAPDRHHLIAGRSGHLLLSEEASENGMRPAVSALFRSVAQTYGPAAIVGLLTGMGKDGARELKQLRELGAFTFAQDQATSIVHGMAGEAIRLGAARMVLPQEKIANTLTGLAKRNSEGRYSS